MFKRRVRPGHIQPKMLQLPASAGQNLETALMITHNVVADHFFSISFSFVFFFFFQRNRECPSVQQSVTPRSRKHEWGPAGRTLAHFYIRTVKAI